MAGFKWRRYFYGFNASPIVEPADRAGSCLRRGGAHGRRRRRLHGVPLHVRRRARILVRLDHDLRRGARRAWRSACRSWRTRHPSKTTRASSRSSSGSSSCRCSCSRARSTRSIRCRSGCSGSAGSRRCGTRPSSADGPYGAELSPAMIAVHFGYLIVLTVVGYILGAALLRDEARQVSASTRRPDAAPGAAACGRCGRATRRGRAARPHRRALVELGRGALGLLRAGVLPAVDGHRPRRSDRHRRDVDRHGGVVRGVHRAGAARGLRDERRDLRLDLERVLQAATTASSTRGCCRPRSARSTWRSARSCTRCCAGSSTPPAS